jgi:WD40 repeat protein
VSGRSCSVRTGGTLAASGSDAAVLLWTVKDLSHPIAQAALPGFLANISALAYRPDGRTLVVGGEDGSVRFEQLADHTFASRASGVVNAVAFGPDGHTLVDTELFGRSVELREVGDPFDTWSVPADLRSTGRVALAPQGHFMIVANSLSPATLWDTTDIHRPAGPTPLASDANTSNVYGPIAFSGNGRVFAAISFDAYGLWDVGEQGVPRIIGHLPPTYNVASAVALNPAGRLIALAGTGKTTGLWDMSIPDSPRLINLLSGLVPGPVPALAFSPDGRLLAASSDDNTVRLFDVHDPDHVAPIDTLTGHSGPVNALAFSPDGRTPATGSSDNTARLWDVHDPDHFGLIATLTGHTGSINALAYSSNGRTLATGSSDRGIGLWDADVEHAAAYLCSLAWPRIGEGDWQRYLPGFDYQPPCPG